MTGASRGLGRWFAVDLAASGADLMLVARSAEGLARTAELATAQGARCETMRGDVCDDDLARAAVSATTEQLGPVDLLVNNAGVGTPARVSDQGIDEWWHVATVNLRAPVMWTMAVLPGMRRRGSGRIINVSSPAALHSPLPYYSSYTASKAGLSQFTAAFAQEVAAEGICVLAFGPVGLTDMTVSTYENDVLPAAMRDAFRSAFTSDPDRLQQLTMALFRLMVRGGADHLSGGYLGAGEPTYEDAALVASLPATDAGLELLARREELTPST